MPWLPGAVRRVSPGSARRVPRLKNCTTEARRARRKRRYKNHIFRLCLPLRALRASVVHTPMLHVALWEPEIPPNTGNIARLCAATGAELHLIGRLGFRLDDRALRRAGLDYWPHVTVRRHPTFEAFEASAADRRIVVLTSKTDRPYTRVSYRD